MSNKVFNKIAQELSSNIKDAISIDRYRKNLEYLQNNKKNVLSYFNRLESALGKRYNLNQTPDDVNSIINLYKTISSIMYNVSMNNVSNEYAVDPEYGGDPDDPNNRKVKDENIDNLLQSLGNVLGKAYPSLQVVEQYIKEQNTKEQAQIRRDKLLADGKITQEQWLQGKEYIEKSDPNKLHEKPAPSKTDQLVFKINQSAINLSNQMYTHLSNTNLDIDTRNAKLTFFNNSANSLNKEANNLYRHLVYLGDKVSNKLDQAKNAINALVNKGIITQAELANRLPNLKSALDIINYFK